MFSLKHTVWLLFTVSSHGFSLAFLPPEPQVLPQVASPLSGSPAPVCGDALTLCHPHPAAPWAQRLGGIEWGPDPGWGCSAGGQRSTDWGWLGRPGWSYTWQRLDPHPLDTRQTSCITHSIWDVLCFYSPESWSITDKVCIDLGAKVHVKKE